MFAAVVPLVPVVSEIGVVRFVLEASEIGVVAFGSTGAEAPRVTEKPAPDGAAVLPAAAELDAAAPALEPAAGVGRSEVVVGVGRSAGAAVDVPVSADRAGAAW
ncbi:MAG: hypothetical protein ACTHMH_11860, partial [Curtobacterium sp.]